MNRSTDDRGRGARIARREKGAYSPYVTDEQRSESGWIGREGGRFVHSRALLIALSAVLVLAQASKAVGHEYEVFIDIEVEEDLYDLLAEQQIGQDTFDTLLPLLQVGVDLNNAGRAELYSLPNLTYDDVDRILAYRKEVGRIDDPAVLVSAKVLSERKLLAIAAFLRIVEPGRALYATDGLIRAQTRWSQEDARVPPTAVLARLATFKHLRLGAVGMITRSRLGDVVFDPNRGALAAAPPSTQLHVPKLYAHWQTDDVDVIVGTYRIGFGQRLTFDNTDQITPNGLYEDDDYYRDADLTRKCKETNGELEFSPCLGAAGDVYVTPDFRWRDGLTGVAGGLERLEVGPGWMQAYGFASVQSKSIYQYEIYDRDVCDDPDDDDNPACSAPYVYREQDDPLAPSSRYSFQTLPDMYRETLAGGNVTYFANHRNHVGVTGYGATVDWLAKGMDLDFQEWSATPYGGPFGALGFDLAWGREWYDLFSEVAYSMDSMPDGGGGLGALVRGVGTFGKNVFESSFRYYDTHFANPHARPIAASDEYEGLRARDEVGGRLAYTGLLSKRFSLRALGDLWYQRSTEAAKSRLRLRGDIQVSKQLRWGLWGEYQNKDLSEFGRGQCYEVSMEEDEAGEPVPCAGQKIQVAGRLRFAPDKTWSIAGQVQHELLDDARYDDKFRQDFSVWAILRIKAADTFRITARSRYLFEDISDNEYLEQTLWNYVDFAYRLPNRYRLRIRYDLVVHLDKRASTEDRVPSPESWLWLELETKF